MKFYPLQFEPILKDRIWGGTKLKTELNKDIISQITGESWEISTVKNEVSIVSNGEFQGKNLNEIIEHYPNEVLGTSVHKRFGFQFPLLFKYLDAKLDLSIQVHPNDELAQKRHHSFGKTEMWYVVQAEDTAELIVGFKKNSSPEEYLTSLNDKSLLSILEIDNVKQGDVFFLKTGTVHAIGAGTLIAEIQQTSDITYRIYDFDRVDASGNKRELHNELALEAINYNKVEAKINYQKTANTANVVVHCPYFNTNILLLNGEMQIENKYNSFIVYMCVAGFLEFILNDTVYSYKKGDTFLVPALILKFKLSGEATLLEIYVS